MQITIKFFLEKLAIYKKHVIGGTILLILTNAIGVYIPIKIKVIVDSLTLNGLIVDSSSWFAVGEITLCAILMAIIRTGSRVVLFGVGRRIEAEEKQKFYEHLLSLDIGYFSTQRVGDLISRATSDIQALRQMMGFGMLNIINIVWVYGLTMPLMFSLNWKLTAWVIVGYIPILYFVRLLSYKLKAQQQEAQEELGTLSSFIEEDIAGIQVIKSYSQEKRELQRFNKINDKYLAISAQLARWRGIIWPIMELAKGISFFVVLLYAN
ncbi:MAG TPA: ABC transporter transmembrane domain-containing protein, partial [Vampirovibrionales bacterium]